MSDTTFIIVYSVLTIATVAVPIILYLDVVRVRRKRWREYEIKRDADRLDSLRMLELMKQNEAKYPSDPTDPTEKTK